MKQNAPASLSFVVPRSAPITVPEGEHLFDAHFMEPQVTAVARVEVKGATRPVELRVPLTLKIAPRVETTMINSPLLVRRGTVLDTKFDVLVRNYAPDAVKGNVMLSVAPSFRSNVGPVRSPKGGERIYSVHANRRQPRTARLFYRAVVEGDVRPSMGVARLVVVMPKARAWESSRVTTTPS